MSTLNVIRKMHQLKKTEGLNPDQVETLRRKRLEKLLRHVLIRSKFYKDYYHKHGITIDKISSIALKDIPPINKEIMMKNFDDLVCDSRIKRADLERFLSDPATVGKKYKSYQVVHTSGSTGSVGIFLYSPNEWDLLKAFVAVRIGKMKPGFKRIRVAYIMTTGGHYMGATYNQDQSGLLVNSLPLSIDSPLEENVRNVNSFQPDLLSGYASGVHLLAQQQIKGNMNIKPKRIICTGDPLNLEMKQTIREAFGIEPVNMYAATESIMLGAYCDTHQGFHLFDDWHCFEVVDNYGNYATRGLPGKVILTNLYNYTQPLIRYQMNDEVVLDNRSCPCGWPFILMKDLAGRSEEILWFSNLNGKRECIHPISIAEFFVPGLERFQLVQTQQDALLMRVMIEGNEAEATSRIHKKMNEILRGKQLESIVKFETQVVKEIENDPKTGKFKLIIPFA